MRLKTSDIKNTGQITRDYIEEMANKNIIRGGLLVLGFFLSFTNFYASNVPLYGPGVTIQVEADTIPLKDRTGDFVTDKTYNPFDIYPSDIEQTVEYDPETNTYIVYEKIGDEYFRAPTYLTFEEYLQWNEEKQQREYFDRLAGFSEEYDAKGTTLIDPLSKIDIEDNLLDRLFGGNDINIEPQGNIDLTFGLDYRRDDNPNLDESRRNQPPLFDFGMDIKMNVEGNIGDKMDLDFNYDTNASFDFDRKIKLAYDSEQFSEDDIIKKIEAGNVSLPLRGTLIQGAQSLFGLKTELQFGKLRLTGIASQQRSRQQNQTIQNGATVQEFELRPDDYDENRHFFISHYHRETFEDKLENLPYINNNMRFTNIEVWISDDRLDYQQNQTMICAIADIGEPDPQYFSKPDAEYDIAEMSLPNIYFDANGLLLPENSTNKLFDQLIDDEQTKRIERTHSNLRAQYDLEDPRDFSIYQGRKLNTSEYTFNEELGFISLNIRLRPNQNLSVSYEYFYTLACDDIYKVGATTDEANVPNTNSSGEVESQGVIYTKMLKSATQTVNHPTWDLMMKNVYPLRTSNLSQVDFQFDIYYEDDADGSLKKFLPEEDFRTLPLLNIFGLDKLNSRNDPQPDGVFDFVPGITVVPQSSSIVFPVLEPFGRSLQDLINDPEVAERYSFPELYDTTVTGAREILVKNKFVMAGRVKSNISSEYSLGAWNIPQGSVRVTAGGNQLIEGQDFEVDYAIGRVRIINESLLQSGAPINVSYEDNSVFSLQQKTMLGLRADYEVNENFYIGGTLMRLFERPFTEKVNIGDDPINNHMYGLDMDFSSEVPWITRAVDKLPFLSTDVPSNVNFTAELAVLDPSHSGAINLNSDNTGVVSIDDFEGAVSGFPLSSQALNIWTLASVPQTAEYPESQEINSLNSGVNRARLSWYVFEQFRNTGNSITNSNPYTRNINQQDLFNRQIPQGLTGNLLTFDMTYNPTERGPYNFDGNMGTPYSSGADVDIDGNVILRDPETRWGGVMRYMPNSDFEASNYQFIEFWLLNPFMEKPAGSDTIGHEADESGFMTFHLGNVSEDIIRDNLQFYENTLPIGDENLPIVEKAYGNVSLAIPKNDGFDIVGQEEQDLGLDGLDDNEERIKFQDYINSWGVQPQELFLDPSGDNYCYYNNLDSCYTDNDNLLKRYSKFNNPQGNSPNISNQTTFARGNPRPDKEDLNNNRSLDQGESFYEYKIPIVHNGAGEIDINNNQFIREIREVEPPNGSPTELWYRFRIPIREGVPFNGIEGFRSIQFMRLIVNGFKTQKTFRMAEFELIRNQWRELASICRTLDGPQEADFNVDAVGIEENGSKTPFPYELPRGIKQERVFNTFSNVLQNEKSLSLIYNNFFGGVSRDAPGCEASIYKLNELDLRLYKRLQMFVHAEKKNQEQQSGDMALFLRLGKDFDQHYYEYEIPLTLSSDSTMYDLSNETWPIENFINMKLDWLVQAKKLRTVLGISVSDTFSLTNELINTSYATAINEYESVEFESFQDTVTQDTVFMPEGHKISIVGNPNLAKIKGIQIGIRNVDTETPNTPHSGEVWVNELRLTGLEERGGVAGLARVDIQLADFGNIAASGAFSSIGFGAIDQKVQDRAIESEREFDISTNLELGKILPPAWNLSVPFYAQYAKAVRTPEYDAYDLDIKVEDEYDLFKTSDLKQDSIRARNQIVNTIKSFNFTNVRKQRGSGRPNAKENSKASQKDVKNSNTNEPPKVKKPKKPMPWDIENLSATYAFTQTEYSDAIIESEVTKDYTFGLNYKYSTKGGYIQPFKKVKAKSLKFIKEINFNPIPNSFSFSSDLNRFVSERRFRIPDTPIFQFDDRRFTWQRRYDLNWNFTKGLKMTYSAINESYIDELRQRGIADDPATRDYYDESGENVGLRSSEEVKEYWQDNIKSGGRNTNYSHSANVNYTLPLKYIPYMDWVDVKATYRTSYSWAAGPLIDIQDGENVGNIIQNSQNRSVTANFNVEKLYNKSKYIKNLDKVKKAKGKTSRTRTTKSAEQDKGEQKEDRKSKTKKNKEPSKIEKILVRPLFMFRSLQINYKEDFSTVIPGFTGTPKYIGLSDGFDAPGTGFIFGIQPDITFGDTGNWLYESANKGWITNSTALNQEVVQTSSQSIDAKIKLEPWDNFRVNIDFKKTYRTSQQQDFKFIDKDGFSDFAQLANRTVGSFEMSYSALNTLFNGDINALFSRFEFNRSVISFRRENVDPSGAHSVDGVEYAAGYGKQSSQVLVPAFLAAYTNADPNTIDLDLESVVSKRSFVPRPNWDVKYDGLNKLPWFRERFSSFTLTHGYSSMLRVNSFNSDVEFDPTEPFEEIKPNGNYYSRIEIPFIQVSEQFNPIIGVKLKTKNDLNLDFEYKKSRTLDLSVNVSSELLETKKTEYVFGFGYTIKDAKLFKKKNKRGGRRSTKDTKTTTGRSTRGSRNVNSSRGSDMTFTMSFSILDDISLVHELDYGAESEPTRGGKTVSFSPSVDYVLNENLTLRGFLEYTGSRPYVSNNYGFTTISGGVTMRMTLN